MKFFLLLVLLPLFSYSQNLMFIGEKSYPSTEVYSFNNQYEYLFVSFIKENDNIMIVASTYYILAYQEPTIAGKLIIYLDDGDVIISDKPKFQDYVNKDCISVYPLTDDDVSSIAKSNINTVRYAIHNKYGDIENRTGTNKGFNIGEELINFSN